jgi:hypothetical protein
VSNVSSHSYAMACGTRAPVASQAAFSLSDFKIAILTDGAVTALQCSMQLSNLCDESHCPLRQILTSGKVMVDSDMLYVGSHAMGLLAVARAAARPASATVKRWHAMQMQNDRCRP